jgi:3'-phosphoadenosine 5'-phosphosulfate (PAPS) 3'-phosphatase
VEEAGGRVTDLSGKPLDFSQGKTLVKNKGVIATNGKLHDIVLKAVKSVIKSQ